MPMNLKKKTLGALAALLAVVMVVPIAAAAAFSSTVLHNADFSLNENKLSYYEKSLNEGGVQKLFYGEYNTASDDAEYEWVIHSIRNGSKTTLTNVMDIAKDYEAKTGRKVIMATNGDYFDFGSGSNMESYVNNGIVLSKGSFATKHCIGYDNQGKVVVGRMTEVERRLMVVVNGQRTLFEIDKFNEEPGENEIAIYTRPGEYDIKGAAKYVCGTESANLEQYPVWGSCRRMKPNTMGDDEKLTLRSNQFAVVVKGEQAKFFYDNVIFSVEVNLVEIPAGKFAGCTWVLGGYDILVDNGKANTSCHTDNSGNAKAPRTFIGFKADGTGFLCVVDGRQNGYSLGITVNKEAELAKALGAQYALELDGGGSSTMIVRINDQLVLRNKPSDGSMRRISNAIMLVEKEKEVPEEKPDTPPATDPTVSTKPTTPANPTTPSATNPASQPTNPTTSGNSVSISGPGILLIAGAVMAVAAVVVVVIVVLGKKKRPNG